MALRGKKTINRALIKNPSSKRSPAKKQTSNSRDAPWFSSLVKDVAKVLENCHDSPLKRNDCDNVESVSKKKETG